jgi:hypothetical protein
MAALGWAGHRRFSRARSCSITATPSPAFSIACPVKRSGLRKRTTAKPPSVSFGPTADKYKIDPDHFGIGGDSSGGHLAATANPLTYVDASDPPFLIMHGDHDQLVPLGQSVILAKALIDTGVTVTFNINPITLIRETHHDPTRDQTFP